MRCISPLMGESLFLASPRKSNQKEGAPAPQECFLRGSLAPLRGALRYSAGAGSAELALRAQTVLADGPRPVSAARRRRGDKIKTTVH